MAWVILGAFIGTFFLLAIVLWLRPGLPHWTYYGRMPRRVLPEQLRRRGEARQLNLGPVRGRRVLRRPVAPESGNWREEDRLGP